MNYLIYILLLLIMSCDDNANLHGCLDSQACNYNPNASIDNNSCIYAEEGHDCDGNCSSPIGWMTGLCDCISEIYDCEGVCDGDAELDECGICNGDGGPCNGLIRGYVYDNNDLPIENAYIFLGYEIIVPSRPSTTLTIDLAQDGNFNLWIENECNQIISTLVENQYLQLGSYQFTWDATNSDGLIVPDGLYKAYINLNNDWIDSTNLVLINHPSSETGIGEINGYIQSTCYNDSGELICEHLAQTDSNGYFEFSKDCISMDAEWEQTDEMGNSIGIWSFGRIRLFADDGQNYGTSNYFEVDPVNGFETTIIINR